MKAGWSLISLGDVCSRITDGSHYSPTTQSVGLPYVTVRDVDDLSGKIDLEACKRISESDFADLVRNGCQPIVGDVLFSKDGTVGKVALVGEMAPFVVLSSLAILSPNQRLIFPRYLQYVMRSSEFLSEAIGKKTGVAIKRIVLKNLRGIKIPLPPLDEQKRIVAVLDEAFEGLSRVRANAEANLADARELFMVALKQSFSRAAAMPNARAMQLGAAFETATGSTPPKSNAMNYGKYLPFVKPPELTDGEVFEAPDNLSAEGAALARVFPAGSVLVSCIGNLGKVGLATRKLTCNQQINVIKPNSLVALPEFMFFQALSPQFREQLTAASSGTTVPIVNKSKFNAIEIALPPLDAQREVVEKLTSIQSYSKMVAVDYHAKSEATELLRQSLLQKAFSGDLT